MSGTVEVEWGGGELWRPIQGSSRPSVFGLRASVEPRGPEESAGVHSRHRPGLMTVRVVGEHLVW